MRRAGIHVTSRPLRYWREMIALPDGSEREVFVPREKGIDLRLGLDVIRMARNGDFDVAIVFSQDQDLAEVASEIRDIARSTNRWLKIACAFPESSSATSHRGSTDLIGFLWNVAFTIAALIHGTTDRPTGGALDRLRELLRCRFF